ARGACGLAWSIFTRAVSPGIAPATWISRPSARPTARPSSSKPSNLTVISSTALLYAWSGLTSGPSSRIITNPHGVRFSRDGRRRAFGRGRQRHRGGAARRGGGARHRHHPAPLRCARHGGVGGRPLLRSARHGGCARGVRALGHPVL